MFVKDPDFKIGGEQELVLNCFHHQVIFFTNQLTIYSLYLVFFKLIIFKL